MKYNLERKLPHLSVLLFVAATVLLINHMALTSNASPTATPTPQGGLSFVGFEIVPEECLGGPQGMRAIFSNTSGNPISVGLAIYLVTEPRESPTFLSSQTLHSSATGIVPANGLLSLVAELPCCAYQADAFLGTTVLTQLSDSGPNYGPDYLRASVNLRDGVFCSGQNEQGTCSTCPQPQEGGREGCTPGYWKNHTDSWAGTGYSPGQTTDSVFSGAGAFPSLASMTLLETLQSGGGTGTTGAARILLRSAVAALLNAASSGVDYPRTQAQIITAVNAALTSNDRDAMLFLAAGLDNDNNLGCPLN